MSADPADTIRRRAHGRPKLAPVRPPRVTVDSRLIRASGIGTYLQNLLPLIIAARPRWRFNLLGRPEELGSFSWARAGHVAVIPCDAPIYGLREQIQLATRIPRETDLVWSPHYNIPLGYRGRLLVTVHDLCHMALPNLVQGAHRRAYARWMFSAVRRMAGRILCSSDFTMGELSRLVGWGTNEPVVVHLGVSRNWFRIQDMGAPYPKPYILYVGNVKPHKNLSTLIRAFSEIAPSFPHDLVVVGKREGFLSNDAAAHAAAIALGTRVRFTGEVSQQVLEQFFLHAELFVLPSFYEGFGLPPLEAMACGCPTIVARAGSLPEICGDATLYFDPADPHALAALLRRVLGCEEVRLGLRERGRQHAAQFSWDRSAQRTLNVMEELLST